jgi:hypothetical protein
MGVDAIVRLDNWARPGKESSTNGRRRLGQLCCPGLRQESGSALVEFAFVLMVLLTLTFGMIDLSRAVYANNVVQAAAQAGARAGLVDMTNVAPTALSRLAGLRPDRAQVTATLTNDQVQVVVTYQFEFITPFLSQRGNGMLNLSASASMRRY